MWANNRYLRWVLVLMTLAGCSMFGRQRPMNELRPMDVERVGTEDSEPKKRVLVLPFIDQSAHQSLKIADISRQALVQYLSRTGKVIVIDNHEFPKDFGSFLVGQQYDLESLAQVASGMGISSILEGQILEIKARKLGDQVGILRQIRARVDATIRLRMVAARNGKEIFNNVRSATVESATTRFASYPNSDSKLYEDPQLIRDVVTKAFLGTVYDIVRGSDKQTWQGRVALVKGERIYINAGRISGLQVGDILKVSESGEEVFDTETGALIGQVPGRMKGTVEIISFFGKDGSIGAIHSGSGFREDDRVELY